MILKAFIARFFMINCFWIICVDVIVRFFWTNDLNQLKLFHGFLSYTFIWKIIVLKNQLVCVSIKLYLFKYNVDNWSSKSFFLCSLLDFVYQNDLKIVWMEMLYNIISSNLLSMFHVLISFSFGFIILEMEMNVVCIFAYLVILLYANDYLVPCMVVILVTFVETLLEPKSIIYAL